MTRAMPNLSHRYGLHPWHFGGDECLTYAEAQAYTDDLRETIRQQQRAGRQ